MAGMDMGVIFVALVCLAATLWMAAALCSIQEEDEDEDRDQEEYIAAYYDRKREENRKRQERRRMWIEKIKLALKNLFRWSD